MLARAILATLSLYAFAAQAIGPADFPAPIVAEQAPREVLQAVSLSARVTENQLRSGLDGSTEGHVIIELRAETHGKFHLYDDKLHVWMANEPVWPTEIVSKPATHRFLDPVSKSLKAGFKGESVFLVKATLPAPRAEPVAGDFVLPLVVGFQACSDKVCLLPVALKIPVSLSTTATPETPTRNPIAALENFLTERLGAGGEFGFGTIALLLVAGLLTAFTPCVYPLYPITLGLFARWAAASRASPFVLALAYCFGIVLTYSILGLVSAATGTIFGALTQTPAFLIGMGLFIVFAALVFAGVINIPLFDRLQGLFSKPLAENQSGLKLYGQAFGMGASLGLVASPCVGPALVVILAWVASQAENAGGSAYLMGFFYLAIFGAGMSLPFLVLGHLTLRMGKNPKLGRYTPIVKNVGTVLMLAASLFFIVPGVQLLRGGTEVEVDFEVLTLDTWPKDKPTVIDFRADWCVACLELERETFTHPTVSQKFKADEWDFVRVDLTVLDDANKAIAARYNVVGLPTVLLTNGNGQICESLKLIGFENAQSFLTRMRKAFENCR